LPSPEVTTTLPSVTIGGEITSDDTRAVHSGLPSGSKASTSPLSVPTTTSMASAPGPAESGLPALARHAGRPVAGSSLTSVPSSAAA